MNWAAVAGQETMQLGCRCICKVGRGGGSGLGLGLVHCFPGR